MQASRTSRLTVTLTLSPLFFESFATSARSFDVRRTWTVASRRRACTSFGMSRQLTHTGSTINACAVRFRALGCGLSFRGHLTTSWARKSSARATARGPTPDASVFRKGFGGVLFYTEHRVCCQTHGMRHPRPQRADRHGHVVRPLECVTLVPHELPYLASCQTHGMRHPRPLRHHARAGAIQPARCDGARVARAPGRE